MVAAGSYDIAADGAPGGKSTPLLVRWSVRNRS
jgi:hypothetical protein